MKTTLTILLLLVGELVFSQGKAFDFPAIDRNAESLDATDPATLSRLLTAPYHTDKEKVRAIFRWITSHISYYRATSRYMPRGRRGYDAYSDPGDETVTDTGTLKSITERVAIKVLKDRRTYCDGYSRLFKSLCDHASIRSEIVTGYARSDIDRAEEKFRSNHSWNAVYVDSAWQLVDATWASGYVSRNTNEFVKHYDDYYFLTPPEQFIRHHYPDDLRWTLLTNPPPLYEFRYTPFKQKSFVKYDITDYYPSRGIIDAQVGDTLHFELDINSVYRNKSIAPDSLWDSAALVLTPVYAYVQPEKVMPGGKVSYTFPVDSERVQWLHIMFNNDAVLRYRLNIRKK